jgi:hypothetical protein
MTDDGCESIPMLMGEPFTDKFSIESSNNVVELDMTHYLVVSACPVPVYRAWTGTVSLASLVE